MEGGPVVLLGQGEQYADPEDWRELVRARRIRRGVELLVRRDGVTRLIRPEEAPELAAVLDAVDPAGPPSQAAPRPSATAGGASSVPLSPPASAAPSPGGAAPPSASGAPGAPAPAAPAAPSRKRWRFGVWRWVFAGAALLLVRLCAADGFGPLPSFGARGEKPAAAPSDAGAAACARPRGWIAKAACDDPRFARLRPELARAYAARTEATAPQARAALAAEQARWQAGRAACRTADDTAACLAERYRARIAELGATPPAAAPASGGARGGDPRPVAVVDRPEWVRRPDVDDLADAYPEPAHRLGIDGRALLSCRATASGGLTACDIVSEDPPDYGFGGAALRLAHLYQLRARTAEGRPVDGARVDVPIAFRGG